MLDPKCAADPFGRVQGVPKSLTRRGRVALLAEAFSALLDGRPADPEAAAFVGGAGMAWLTQGGSIERDFWRVAAPAGSHLTPARLWSETRSSRGATSATTIAIIDPDDDSNG